MQAPSTQTSFPLQLVASQAHVPPWQTRPRPQLAPCGFGWHVPCRHVVQRPHGLKHFFLGLRFLAAVAVRSRALSPAVSVSR